MVDTCWLRSDLRVVRLSSVLGLHSTGSLLGFSLPLLVLRPLSFKQKITLKKKKKVGMELWAQKSLRV